MVDLLVQAITRPITPGNAIKAASAIIIFNLNNSQTIKIVIPAKPVLAKAGSGNPLQINNLVQVMDARLLGHDNIEVFCLKWKFMN